MPLSLLPFKPSHEVQEEGQNIAIPESLIPIGGNRRLFRIAQIWVFKFVR